MSKEQEWIPAPGDRVRLKPILMNGEQVFVIKKLMLAPKPTEKPVTEKLEPVNTDYTGLGNKITSRSFGDN